MSGLNPTLFPLPDRIIAEFPSGHELPLCYAKHFRSQDSRFALILPYILCMILLPYWLAFLVLKLMHDSCHFDRPSNAQCWNCCRIWNDFFSTATELANRACLHFQLRLKKNQNKDSILDTIFVFVALSKWHRVRINKQIVLQIFAYRWEISNIFVSESKRETCKWKWSWSDCANHYTIEFWCEVAWILNLTF